MSFWEKIFSTANDGKKIQDTDVFAHKKESEISGDAQQEKMEHTKIFTALKKAPQVKQALPAVLKVVTGIDLGLEATIESGQVNIGRMPGSELLLTDTSISRMHAFVVNEDGHHVLYDGKSTNGTFLNNQRISQRVLQHGDLIKIGNTVLVYELQ